MSRKNRRNNNGLSLKPTALAAVVATLPDEPTKSPALSLVEPAVSVVQDNITSGVSTDISTELESSTLSNADLEPPKTRADVSPERLMWIVKQLLGQPGVIRGELFHQLGPKSLGETMLELGCRTVPYLLGLMQETGVLRWYQRKWFVMDDAFIGEALTLEWVTRCETKLLRHNEQTRDLLQLEKMKEEIGELKQALEEAKAASVQSAPAATDPSDEALMIQVAGLLEDIERLNAKANEQVDIIAEQKRKLAEPPKVTAMHVAQYLADLRTKRT